LRLLTAVLALGAVAAVTRAADEPRAQPVPPASARRPFPLAAPLRFSTAAVASDSVLASRAGAAILERGGNAVDAAIATAFALAVTHPSAGNIGGGGFLVVRLPDGTAAAFDFRETAPAAARPDMFLGAGGQYDPERHHRSALAVGVPGTVAGLALAHQRFGKLPWRDLVSPAVELARGFPVTSALAEELAEVLPSMRKYAASIAQFSRDGTPLRKGDTLAQTDLASTLERIRDHGAGGFYNGETAHLLAREMERLGGLITEADLAGYRAIERQPVAGSYRGFQVLSMPPPSSGGVALIAMLNILEGYDLASLGFRSAREAHLLIEAMRRAYADRARHLGDPDRIAVPVEILVSKERAAELRATIHPARASRSTPASFEWPRESTETTHLSVIDGDLMAVALTTTLEDSYGSRIVVPGAGFLLNNEMGDFNAIPGLTDETGKIGTPPNLAAPGKRMLSSMTPAILSRDGKPFLVLGSPGGRTIINTVLEVIINVIDHQLSIQDAVNAPRFHHQWLPDRALAEPRCFSPDTLTALAAMGHDIATTSHQQGSVMAFLVRADAREGRLEAGVDRRRPDAGAAGR
jgi:gamma-glutamyltranspeptidase/glutathione hydrolase